MAGESAAQVAARQRDKAERLLRRAEMYEKGAAGEAQTAQALACLPTFAWTVFHDVRWPGRQRANIDHIVIGRPGVFVVDSKNWSGRVQLKDGVLRQNGYRRENEVAGATDAARAVAGIASDLDPRLVRGVLCITRSDLLDLAGWSRGVAVTTTVNIVDMLLTAPVALSEAQVATVARLVEVGTSAVGAGGVGTRRTLQINPPPAQVASPSKPKFLRRLLG